MRIPVRFTEHNRNFRVKFSENESSFSTDFKSLQVISVRPKDEYYTGDYEVTPTINGRILQTARKTMSNDVVIKKIPYAEVSNNANGVTVTIA